MKPKLSMSVAGAIVRSSLIGAALVLLAAPSADAAGWERSTPWCVRSVDGFDDCAYYTIEQCRATVSGLGGTCVHNPHFMPGRERVRPRRKARWLRG